MVVDRRSRRFKIIIVQPGETESTGLDVSAIVASFEGGNNAIGQSGICSFTGDLTLNAYSLGSGINTNPRSDRKRWARGNRVIIYLADSSGTLLKYKTLHILKAPLAPTPQTRPTLQISTGDKLSLLSFRQPPGDESGVEPGTSKTRLQVVNALLAAAGAGMVFGSIPGNVPWPLQKLCNESFIQEAGQIAFAAGRYLWVDRAGTVRASALPLDNSGSAIARSSLGRMS
jgi:hypothetical protein